MSVSRYYKILGLEIGADHNTIRKRYRKLVLLYHPDKNPSLEAQKKFIEIAEAYEILTGKKDPPKEIRSKNRSSNTNEERIKEAKKRYYDQIRKEQIEQERYFQSLFQGKKWLIIKVSSITGILLSFLITLDMFLPQHQKNIEISHYAENVSSFNDWDYLSVLKTKNGSKYWVSSFNLEYLKNNDQLILCESWLFHEPIKIICAGPYNDYIFPVKLTFYAFGPLLIIIFLLPALAFFYRRKKSFYTLIYYLSLLISPFLMLIFIFSNYHWFHLIGLGFI